MADADHAGGLNGAGDGVLTLPRSGLRMAVLLINLDRAETRRALMADRLAAAGLPWRRLPAVDGRALSFPIPEFSPASYALLHGRRTVPAEIGCYLSHVDACRVFLDGGADLALILEDDVSFLPGFIDTLDRAALAGDWDLLRLTTVNRGRKYAYHDLGNDHALAIALTREKGAGAYVVNRAAAGWIASLLPMRLAYDIAFDLEFFAGLRAAYVDPLPASQRSDQPTQIQADINSYKLPVWRYLTVLPFRAVLETARLVMRGARLLRLRLRRRDGAAQG